MPTLESMSSIFELGFGVNAVAPILYSTFDTVRQSITQAVADMFQEHDPDFKLTSRKRLLLDDFVFKSSSGIKATKRLLALPVIILTVGVGVSFLGVVSAIIWPRYEISVQSVWDLAISLLLAGPLLAIFVERCLGQLARLLIHEWAKSPDFVDRMYPVFKIMLESQKTIDQMSLAIRAADVMINRLHRSRLEREIKE